MLKKKKFQSGVKSFGALDYIISTVLFAAIFISLFLTIAALFGFVFFKLPYPLKMTEIATLGALYLGALAASFIISKKNGQKYLICALFNSFLLTALLLILSLFGENGIFSLDFLLRISCVPICFLGAFLGIKRSKIKKHNRRK